MSEEKKELDEQTKKEKSRLLWSLLACYTISQTSYLNVYALLPLYMEQHFNFSNMSVGLLLASYQVSFTLSAPFIGTFLSKIGRRQAIQIGLIVMSFATVMFAASSFMVRPELFFGVSLMARMIQGIADGLICVTIPSVIGNEFPNKTEIYMGYLEAAMGLGLTLGPVICSFVYTYLGYAGTYFFFAIFLLTFGLITTCFIPARLDQ